MEKEKIFTISSNIFFIPPIIWAVIISDTVLMVLLSLMMIFSIFYHSVKRSGLDWFWYKGRTTLHTVLLFVDTFFATSVFFLVLLRYAGDIWTMREWFAVILLIVGSIPFIFPKKGYYGICHAIWHFCTGVALILFIL